MIQTYHLNNYDTLASVLARVQAASDERVLLIVPSGLVFSQVELRALRREAARSRKVVALVTTEMALRTRADAEGISIFRTPEAAEEHRWRRPRADARLAVRPATPSEVTPPHPASLFARRSPTGFRPFAIMRAFGRKQSPWWATLSLTVFLFLIFGVLLYALMAFIPAATITLTPVTEPLLINVPLRAVQDARPDIAEGIVPAQTLSVQVTGEARTQTTGRRNEPATKSRGRVTFINRTSRDVMIPSGTIVSTATGNNVQFGTTADVVIPPNGRVPVQVEALLAGPAGNVSAGTVTRVEGPASLSVMVANAEGFFGGSTQPMAVVLEDDKVRLEEQLFAQLQEEALARLNERVAGTMIIPPESVTFLKLAPTFTPFVGEVAEELYLSMSVRAVGLGVDRDAAGAIGLNRLQAAMPPGTRLISETVRYAPGAAVLESTNTIAYSVSAQGTLLRNIDAAEVREAVKGLSVGEAERALRERFPLAAAPQISLGPDWLPYIMPVDLPALPWRIRVVLDWDSAAQLALAAGQQAQQ
jgi:hypothetical protein